jgi:hypothetical protein
VLSRNDSTIDSIHYDGELVDYRFKELIDKSIMGDRIYFENIEAIGEDKEIRRIQSLAIGIYE